MAVVRWKVGPNAGHVKRNEPMDDVKNVHANSRMNPEGRRLWVDDERPAPPGWDWARTFDEAIHLLSKGDVVEVSLDHDLGDVRPPPSDPVTDDPYQGGGQEKTGHHVVLWMAEHDAWPQTVRVHSANPVGRARIRETVLRYRPEGTGLVMDPIGGRST